MAHKTGKIHHGDCIKLMHKMDEGSVDLVFADPPFNIGYEYDQYDDRQEDKAYMDWSREWIRQVHRVLKPNGTFWLAIGDEYAAELKVAAQREIGFFTRSWVVWYYTFGVNCKLKFSRSHAHLFHFVKNETTFTFNAYDPLVRVPSARALVYGDKRANPQGRLPDDTWILRPQDFQSDKYGFDPLDDTWYFARVAGTFKERQGFHGCQMPEQLLARIIRVSSNEGNTVLDPFTGSGTTLAVAKKLGRQWLGCELSEEYVSAATDRLARVHAGDPIDGPADPIASAPSTANGRRLSPIGLPLDNSRVNGVHKSTVSSASKIESAPTIPPRPLPPADDETPSFAPKVVKRDVREVLRDAIIEAYFATHDGYSTDWLLADPALQTAYHEACRKSGLIGQPMDWNRELLRLRKTGSFPKRDDTKRVNVTSDELEGCGFAAEIAWRLTGDKYSGASLDEIFCDPTKAAFFDHKARTYAPGFATPLYRWAALRLRKASHSLAKDLQNFKHVVAQRDFPPRPKKWSTFPIDRLAGQRGIYALRDSSRRHLFIGLASDLGARLQQHAECKPLARYVDYVSIIAEDDLRMCANYMHELKIDLVRRYHALYNMHLHDLSHVRDGETSSRTSISRNARGILV